jgi:hypothetical protein
MADAWEVIDELHIEVDEIIDVGDGETVVTVQRVLGTIHNAHPERPRTPVGGRMDRAFSQGGPRPELT